MPELLCWKPLNMLNRLIIKGARGHNLKNLTSGQNRDCHQRDFETAKLASFDTIFAEGQRRYVESLSSYARNVLG